MQKYQPLNKLKGRITEKESTYRELSKKTGISLHSLSNKINGHSLFDIVEVSKICTELDIPPEDIPIFFSVSCETQRRNN